MAGKELDLGTHMCFTEDKAYFERANSFKKIYQERQELWDKYLGELLKQKSFQADSNTFVLADFGTADGKMIMPQFKRMIEQIRQYLKYDVEIQLVFEDQQQNNFNVLVRNVQEFKKEVDPVNCFVSATSMYDRCVQKNFIDFAFSVTAIHWLSKRPCFISQGIFYSDTNGEELALFRDQSQEDLFQFLTLRLQEIKPGGIIYVSCPARPNNGSLFENIYFSAHFKHSLQTLLEGRSITEEEFLHINVLLWPRTPKDFEEVFERCANKNIKFGIRDFKLLLQESVPALDGKESMDPQKRAQQYKDVHGFVKTIFYNSIYQGLSENRTVEEKKKISDRYIDIFMDNLPIEECKFSFHMAEFFVFKPL